MRNYEQKHRCESGKSNKAMKKATEVARTGEMSVTDPQGSYTGVPENPRENPVQDADDL